MKIGNREVVHTFSIIVPDKEDAWVDFNVGQWNINLRIYFTEDKGKDTGALSLEVLQDIPHLNLINWRNALGTATIKPIELGTTSDGRQLSFMLTHWLIGETNKLDIQFLLGGES
jgi:hypothetical protein